MQAWSDPPSVLPANQDSRPALEQAGARCLENCRRWKIPRNHWVRIYLAHRRWRMPRWATICGSNGLSRFYRLLPCLRPYAAVRRRRPGPGGRRRAALCADRARDAGPLRLRAHAEGPAERLRHALSLRPSLAGEAGPLLLARDVSVSGLRRARLERAAALDHLRLHHGRRSSTCTCGDSVPAGTWMRR